MFPSRKYPLITVAIPTHNRAKDLVRAVQSVQLQNYPRIEILISDNDSSDETAEICQSLAQADPQIRLFRHSPDIGPLRNFAFLKAQSRGDFFMWLADDDWLEPEILSRYVTFLMAHPDYVMVSGIVRYWHEEKVYLEERGFSFEQEKEVERIGAFYRKVDAGGVFHGLLRGTVVPEIEVRNILGSDWAFISDLLVHGKVKQFDFYAYNKDLMGLSTNFDWYACTVGAGHLARANPLLALCWYAVMPIVTDRKVYGHLSRVRRLQLASFAYCSLVRRVYFGQLIRQPRRFCRMFVRSVVKTLVPPAGISFFHRIREFLTQLFFRKLSNRQSNRRLPDQSVQQVLEPSTRNLTQRRLGVSPKESDG